MNILAISPLNNLFPAIITLISLAKASLIFVRIVFDLKALMKNGEGNKTKNRVEEIQLNEPMVVDGSKEENRLTIMVS